MSPSTTLMATGSPNIEIRFEGSNIHPNASVPWLLEAAVRANEGVFANNGAFCAETTPYTGRSAKDKFMVKDELTSDKVEWGEINQPFEPVAFARLAEKMQRYLATRNVFVQDLFAGADVRYRLPVRVACELAWHSAFARQLLVRPLAYEAPAFQPKFTILCAPGFEANPAEDGTRSGAFIVISFSRRVALIGGTKYAGEIKKSVFSVNGSRKRDTNCGLCRRRRVLFCRAAASSFVLQTRRMAGSSGSGRHVSGIGTQNFNILRNARKAALTIIRHA